MELHAFNRVLPVPQAHDGACAVFLGRPGADFQLWRKAFFFDDQRVVAGSRHRHGQAFKNGLVVVNHGTGFAVHEVGGSHYVAAERLADCLMPEANTEHRHFSREATNQFDADTRLGRSARPRRNHDAVRLHLSHIGDRDLVIAAHLNLFPQFADILNQVVSERIVVVENEDQESRSFSDYRILGIIADSESSDVGLFSRGESANRPRAFSPLKEPLADPTVVLTLTHAGCILSTSFNQGRIATSSSRRDTMAEPQQEKRSARRFALRVPVTVDHGESKNGHNEIAQIRDVSARGICFYLDAALEQGAPIGFTLTLPPEITLTESIRVQCKGRVVRVENGQPDGKLAVAAVIEEYEFLPEA